MSPKRFLMQGHHDLNLLVSRFDSVQYGQYHDTSMLKNEVMMTSLMINLDSHADFFNEIPEYSEYMVSCSEVFKIFFKIFESSLDVFSS